MTKRKRIYYHGAYYNESMTTLYRVEAPEKGKNDEFIVPEGVTRICARAFKGAQFESIVLSSAIRYIGRDAFRGVAKETEFISFMMRPHVAQKGVFIFDEDLVAHYPLHLLPGLMLRFYHTEWFKFDNIICNVDPYSWKKIPNIKDILRERLQQNSGDTDAANQN